MKSHALFAFTLLFASASLFAVEPGGDHKLAQHWKTSKEFTLAVAEQMPAESYNFKLTPAQMSFGEQMAHIAGANMYFFSTLKGEKPPSGKPADYEKATIIKLLNDSFDYSTKALESLTPEQINKTYKAEDQEMSGSEMIMLAFDHTTHHRSACEMYLRAKNIKPTDYRF